MCQDLAGNGLQPRGVQFVHAVLRAGLQNAMRDELVARNLAKLVQVQSPQYEVGQGRPAAVSSTITPQRHGHQRHVTASGSAI